MRHKGFSVHQRRIAAGWREIVVLRPGYACVTDVTEENQTFLTRACVSKD
jgi:hypothetical protein